MTASRLNQLRNPVHRAFTLVELILVLLIMTIMIGIVAPSLTGFKTGRTKTDAATLVVSLAGYARAQSISEAVTYRLNLETQSTQKQIWLTVSHSGGPFTAPTNDYGQRFDISRDVAVQSDLQQRDDGTYIEFQPTGRTEPGHLTFTDKQGATTQVACESPTELYHILTPQEIR